MDEVATVIDNQRKSVSSVDTNEEASSLVIYQNGYNLAAKVISVMNEVYDKLINQTGLQHIIYIMNEYWPSFDGLLFVAGMCGHVF